MNDVNEVTVDVSNGTIEPGAVAHEPPSKGADLGQSGWGEAIAASAEAQQADVERETVVDDIDIPADPERIGRELVLVDNKIKACRTDFDAAKATLKAKKAALEAAEGERDELIDALRTHVQTISGKFVVESDYRTLTERWIDENGETVRTLPLSGERRQTKLFDTAHLAQTGEGGEADEPEDESPVLEDRLDRALDDSDPDLDDTTGVVDPEAVLDGSAATPDAASEPPSKPSRRARKAS